MTPSEERTERRLRDLERELRLWRLVGVLLVAGAALGSCDAPSEELSALDLVSADGSRRMHLGPEGLHIEAGERSADFSAERVHLSDGTRSASLAPDALGMTGEGGAHAVVRADTISVSAGTAQAELSIEGGNTAHVRASTLPAAPGESASATMSATGGESTWMLRVRGEGSEVRSAVTALASSTTSQVVVGPPEGLRHVYGAE
jgi:hypothetical protein